MIPEQRVEVAFGFGRWIYALQKYGVVRAILLTMLGRAVGILDLAYNTLLLRQACLHNLYKQTRTQMAKDPELDCASDPENVSSCDVVLESVPRDSSASNGSVLAELAEAEAEANP